MKILFTGGGTGGHFFPIVAIIREMKRIAEEERILDLEFYYMGPDDYGQEILEAENVICMTAQSGKIRTYFSPANFLSPFQMAIGVIQAIWNFFLLVPDVVFSKGGHGSVPAVVAAWLFRVPLIIHESDAVPGKANTFGARFARRIGIAFQGAADFFPPEKTALVGVPIRKTLFGGNIAAAKEEFDASSGAPVLGIIGASQGSKVINETVLDALKELTDHYEVIHQTGKENYEDVRGEAKVVLEYARQERYHPYPFFDERKMREFYSASNVIVSRASASSIYEIAAWGKPSVLIPLEIAAQDHQRKNAYEYASNGAALVIEEENLKPHLLVAEVRKIFENPALMKKMSEAAQKFARVDAATIIARELLKVGIH